jgi:hypothetical protein
LANKQLQNTFIQLLKDGHPIEVPAHGMSMFPLLLPGDILLVEPTKPKIGEIGIFISNQILIAHRLCNIDNNFYHFKGDAIIHFDLPIPHNQVLGTVMGRRRKKLTKSSSKGSFNLFSKIIPKTTLISGRLFFYSGRIYTKIFRLLDRQV